MSDTIEKSPVTSAVNAPQWRNLWFLRDGRFEFGELIWPSEESAREAADEFMRDLCGYTLWGFGIVPIADISYHMQIPLA